MVFFFFCMGMAEAHIIETVALSRAREGLYILGNASNLSSRSEMWRSVISQLEEDNSVGDAFPVRCHRHQEAVEYISRPGHLPRIAPDGKSHPVVVFLS